MVDGGRSLIRAIVRQRPSERTALSHFADRLRRWMQCLHSSGLIINSLAQVGSNAHNASSLEPQCRISRQDRRRQPMRRDPAPIVTGDTVPDSRAQDARGRRLKERAVHEARRFVFIFLYLFILFGLFTIHEAIILEQHHIDYTYAGFALVNALI